MPACDLDQLLLCLTPGAVLMQVAPDAPEIVAGIARLAECLDKVGTFSDLAGNGLDEQPPSSGSPMSTNTTTSRP